jgi:hypothetical protein
MPYSFVAQQVLFKVDRFPASLLQMASFWLHGPSSSTKCDSELDNNLHYFKGLEATLLG